MQKMLFSILMLVLMTLVGCEVEQNNEQIIVEDNKVIENIESNNDPSFQEENEQNLISQGTSFKTNSDGIVIGNQDLFNIDKSLTISLWAKPEVDHIGSMVSKILGPSDQSYGLFVMTGSKAMLWISEDGKGKVRSRLTSKHNLELNQWQHIVAVYNYESRTVNMYMNGEPSYGELEGVIPEQLYLGTASLVFGQETDGAYPYKGNLAGIKIFNKALNQEEVKKLYEEGVFGEMQEDNNLIGYWPLKENFEDQSKYKNHGTPIGAVEIENVGQ